MSVAIEVRDKLAVLGGLGPLKMRVAEVKRRLSKVRNSYWRSFHALGRIKRFIYLEQIPSAEETDDIRAAYALMCTETLSKHRREDAELVNSIIQFARQAAQAGEGYHRVHLDEIRHALVLAGCAETGTGKPPLSSP